LRTGSGGCTACSAHQDLSSSLRSVSSSISRRGRVVRVNAAEAAALTAVLRPAVAIPHHYAFTSGWLGDRMITRSDPDPRHFAAAAAELAPATAVRLTLPGEHTPIP
jgi:L-ascorbate metabolism protein UlaG (beta-lactamase superfamily)